MDQPTREDAFLDLILTPGDGKVHILPKLGSSDHRTIYAELDLGLVGIEEPPKQRKVFHWGKARWGELKKEVKKPTSTLRVLECRRPWTQ